MSKFQTALDAFLKELEGGEVAFAEMIGSTQASVNRYRNGKRFPDAKMARVMDEKSDGKIPFSVWQSAFMERSGLEKEADAA